MIDLKLIFGSEVADEIENILAILKPREREVFLIRQGFDRNGKPPSFREIAESYPVTGKRLQQIYSKAMRKLRGFARLGRFENIVLQVPLFSCDCGKWEGSRCIGVLCDKCGTWVVRKGEAQKPLID